MSILLHMWSLGAPLLRGKLSPHDLPGLAQKAGLDGVEWFDRLMPSYAEEDWRSLADAQEKAGLKAAALSLSLEILSSPARLAEQVDRAKQTLGLAKLLGVSAVRISIGGGGGLSLNRWLHKLEGLRSREARDQSPLGQANLLVYRLALPLVRQKAPSAAPAPASPDLLQSAAWTLQPLARQARDMGMVMGLENHPGLTQRSEDLLSILELCGQDLGVCLDTGNFPPGQDPLEAARRMIDQVKHVHLKLGQENSSTGRSGAGGSRRILELLQNSGYGGHYSLEYTGKGDALAACQEAAAWLR